MAITRIATVTASSAAGSSITSGAIDTTGANFLVFVLAEATTASEMTVSDSKGNTWNGLTSQSAGQVRVRIFWSTPTSVGSGHTFTATTVDGDTFPAIGVSAYSGVKASSPFDQQNGATNTSSTIATGNVTPTEDNELIISGICALTSSFSINSGLTIRGSKLFVPATSVGMAIADLVETSITAKNPTWTLSASDDNAAAIATFKGVPSTATGNFFMFFSWLLALALGCSR